MRKDMNAYELVKEANNVSIEITTKLLVEKGLLSQGSKKKQNHFLCIYHQDTNPDLSIWKRGNRVKCFVCNTSAKGAELYADALIAKRFKNTNIEMLLNSDIEKLEKSSLDKDRELLSKIKEIKDEQHLAIWEAASYICHKSNIISNDELQENLKSIDRARNTSNIPKLYYPKLSNNGKNKVGSYAYESNDINYNYELNNFEDVANKILENYDFDSIASREELATAYHIYIESIIEFRKKRLRKVDYKHLKNVRGMSDGYMEFYGYVSLPKKDEVEGIIKLTLKKLRKANINVDILKKIPGFIYNEKLDNYTIYIPYNEEEFFYIPIPDFYSNIKRFQIKLYGDIKYKWNSTPKPWNYEQLSYTIPDCKSPVSVRYPYKKNYKSFKKGDLKPNEFLKSLLRKIDVELDEDTYAICITEGEFKAVSIANTFNIPVLGVQGLGSWVNFLPSMYEFYRTLKSIGKEKFIFLIGFDADTKIKPNLSHYGRDLSRVLRNCELTGYLSEDGKYIVPGIDTYYITWNLKAGKGFDDVMLAGNKDSIKLVKAEDYEEKDILIKEYIALRKGTHSSQLTQSDLQTKYESLEKKDTKFLKEMVERYTLLNDISETLFGEPLALLSKENSLKMNKYVNLNISELKKIFIEITKA